MAIKDNVCVAGVPMMNGSATLEGYVPEVDATIVTRTLDAGATIVGKAVCEDLCFSGGSHTAATGPVLNPRAPGRSAGGSSCGSAALLAAGEVDLAIGGDQGGSIRMPAGWCGVVGHKPTYGLVPYTGVFPIELTLDHTGPMAATVADVALYLEVLAGADGLDPRQPSVVPTEAYGDRARRRPLRPAGRDRRPRASGGRAGPRRRSTRRCGTPPGGWRRRGRRSATCRCRCTGRVRPSGR